MTDILLALCVGAAFALGYLPMRRLDRFLEGHREAAEGQDRRASEDLRGDARGERRRRTRALGHRIPLAGGWRGGLFPLRHRG